MFEFFYNFLDGIFLPLIKSFHPAIAILIIALIVSLITNVATKLLVNQERVAEIKEELKNYQKKLKLAQKNPDLMQELQKEQEKYLKLNTELMKMSFKPMIYTWIPIILIFIYLKHVYGFNGLYHQLYPNWNGVVVYLPTIIAKIMLLDFWHWLGSIFYKGGFPIVKNALGWLGWYILNSIAFSTVLRKILGIK
ncbi:EMC3/TMCO1 family protein [Methanocaldococcus indicus]|uniref:EMC3/TMCO1 family protein n=1 Tax=Methanocaldococcus indicus TaxID=213231 RepID=UPI003C6D0773